MNPALGACDVRHDRRHLTRVEYCKRTTRPRVERPSVDGTAFELPGHLRESLRHQLRTETHGARPGHPRKLLPELSADGRAEYPPRRVVIVSAIPHLRRLIASRASAEAHRLPETAAALKQQPCRGEVRKSGNS